MEHLRGSGGLQEMAEEALLVYQFVIIAAAIWLFVHLTFGIGDFRDAVLLGVLAAVMLPLMQGQDYAVFAGILALGGFIAMRRYKVDLLPGIAMVLLAVIVSRYLFPFQG